MDADIYLYTLNTGFYIFFEWNCIQVANKLIYKLNFYNEHRIKHFLLCQVKENGFISSKLKTIRQTIVVIKLKSRLKHANVFVWSK